MFRLLDQNTPVQIIEDDVVRGETVPGATAPTDACKQIVIGGVMNCGTVQGLLGKIYTTVFIPKYGVAISEDIVGAVNSDSLTAPPCGVIDRNPIARSNEKADACVTLMTEDKPGDRHIMLAYHSDAVVAALQFEFVAGRGSIVARVNV